MSSCHYDSCIQHNYLVNCRKESPRVCGEGEGKRTCEYERGKGRHEKGGCERECEFEGRAHTHCVGRVCELVEEVYTLPEICIARADMTRNR